MVFQFQFKAKVPGHFKDVYHRFDRKLFEALKPPLSKMEVLEFTGSRKGDRVHLKFHRPIPFSWKSEITEDGLLEDRAYFVDHGTQLPLGIQFWEHRHIVKQLDEEHSTIIDDIRWSGKNLLHGLLLYPFLYFAFYFRKFAYKSYFQEEK